MEVFDGRKTAHHHLERSNMPNLTHDAQVKSETLVYQRFEVATKELLEHATESLSKPQYQRTTLEAASEDAQDTAAAAQSLTGLQREAQALKAWSQEQQSQKRPRDGILTNLDALIESARSKFYSYRLDKLPPIWRNIFSDAHVLKTYHRLLLRQSGGGEPLSELLDFVSEHLDRAVIVAGKNAGSLGAWWFDETLDLLEQWEEEERDQEVERPAKRARVDESDEEGLFTASQPFGQPSISATHEIPRHDDWSLENFEDYVNDPECDPRPRIFTNLIGNWPALTDRPWASRDYLLKKTFNGRRLVPVEVGRSYVDEGWGQELIPFRAFVEKYVDPTLLADAGHSTIGYLAQHDLFQQIPSLRNDITIPDFCWASVPGHPTDPTADKPTLDFPQLNAWFGPARTITPLHTDGYHNLLCQVVGTKYVRLYPPTVDKEIIRPRGEEMGVSMANTSEIDVGVLEGWDEPDRELDKVELDAMRDDLKDVEYWECVLGPGDALLIPIGWWHYVRSLSVSFSVSFWWN